MSPAMSPCSSPDESSGVRCVARHVPGGSCRSHSRTREKPTQAAAWHCPECGRQAVTIDPRPAPLSPRAGPTTSPEPPPRSVMGTFRRTALHRHTVAFTNATRPAASISRSRWRGARLRAPCPPGTNQPYRQGNGLLVNADRRPNPLAPKSTLRLADQRCGTKDEGSSPELT